MKKLFFSLATLTMLGGFATAQNKIFNATYTPSASYDTLSSNATVVPFAPGWDDEYSDPISLPFTFKYQNTPINTITIDTYGALLLNNTIINEDFMGQIMGIYMDYADNKSNNSIIQYETTGNAGDRIFKIEFKNIGTYNDYTGNDTVNFQIWLYENNSAIEYRAGYTNLPDSIFAKNLSDIEDKELEPLLIGVNYNNGDQIRYDVDTVLLHATKWNASTFTDTILQLDMYNTNFTNAELEAVIYGNYPVNGSVIRFESIPAGNTSLNDIKSEDINIFPIPSKDGKFNIHISKTAKDAMIKVYDLNGKLIVSQNTSKDHNIINLSNAPTGNYIAIITIGRQTLQYKLVKE